MKRARDKRHRSTAERLMENGIIGRQGTLILFDPSDIYRRGAAFPTRQFVDLVRQGLLPEGFTVFSRSHSGFNLLEIDGSGNAVNALTGEMVLEREEDWYWEEQMGKSQEVLYDFKTLVERWYITTLEQRVLEMRIAKMLHENPEFRQFCTSGDVSIHGEDGDMMIKMRLGDLEVAHPLPEATKGRK